ncbi:VWA domain-containing protein [Lutispora saccharofermentans]|uniref:VWA domain-containing protein n=1 Tax=Lutispora saccharofermentans TaxID=3024236 RepID=A0ABT1NBD1_9FIRM|nr:vWA domain-containing protein [Lutispora saccharofermentans]MCQ1528569.1 VWA domain-containing protein [Lutispora saccharofermentans]
MVKRRVSILMLCFSMTGGLLGFFFGEWLIDKFLLVWPSTVLMGMYFGILALFIGIMCILAEKIRPVLISASWTSKYYKSSLKYLVPCTLVLLFLCAGLFQYIYGLNFQKARNIDDIVILVDNSGSLKDTDPQNKRFEAVESLIAEMNVQNRISVSVFSDNVNKVQNMEAVTPEVKSNILSKLDDYKIPDGRTNIKGAILNAFSDIYNAAQDDRAAMVILLSDGGDNFNLADTFQETLEPYIESNIPIFSIGMAGSDVKMLKRISQATGGNYYNVSRVENVENIFNKIYREKDLRLLVGERHGSTSYSILYSIMRIAFIAVIGAIIGISVGVLFDDKYIARSFALGGLLAGIAGGAIIEAGFRLAPWMGFFHRLLADISLSAIFALFPFAVGINEAQNTGKKNADIRKESSSRGSRDIGKTQSRSF